MIMQIETDFFPGAIGAITRFHGEYYAEHWGFGTFFEAKVASELSVFALRKSDSDLVLLARDEEGLAGSLIIDLNDPDSGDRGAHLRWFFAADRCRGHGIGKQMMARAMAHVDAHAGGASWLTTFAGLHSALALYKAHGYVLAKQEAGKTWGIEVDVQEFRRPPALG